jgi:hypothetical protein
LPHHCRHPAEGRDPFHRPYEWRIGSIQSFQNHRQGREFNGMGPALRRDDNPWWPFGGMTTRGDLPTAPSPRQGGPELREFFHDPLVTSADVAAVFLQIGVIDRLDRLEDPVFDEETPMNRRLGQQLG